MVEGEIVSTNYFEMLRVSPVLGRFFAPQDDDGAAPIVLSHRLWQQGFGGDPEVVGRMIRLRRRAFQVIGVAPAGFNGAMLLIASDYWIPLGVQAALLADGAAGISDGGTDERQSNDPSWFGLVGRLKPDVTLPEAEAQLTTIASRLPRAAQDRAPAAVVVRPATGFGVPAGVRGQVVGPSAILLALGLLVLGVSVTNVACLLLARASTRSREIGVRLALGARPRQVLRQILTENVVLALLGGAAGVVLAYWVSDLWTVFGSSTSEYVSFVLDVRPDARVFVAALLVSACVGVTIGLAPGLQATRIDPAAAMTVSRTPSGARRGTFRALNLLVIGQLAASTVPLVAAGLLVRSFLHVRDSDPGFDTRNVLAISLDLTQAGYGVTQGQALYDELLALTLPHPGVRAVSFSRTVPLSPAGRLVTVVSQNGTDAGDDQTLSGVGSGLVSPGYFETLRMPLLRGRDFTANDRGGGAPVAVVNQTMARRRSAGAAIPSRRPYCRTAGGYRRGQDG